MGKSRFREGDHVIRNKNGKHGDVEKIVNSMGTEMPEVKWTNGGKDTVFDSELSGTRQCGGRGGCTQR